MPIKTGYSIADVAALKALTTAQRANNYARLVTAEAAWYMFAASSEAIEDNVNIIAPVDNPTTGRWIRCNHDGACSGDMICADNCSVGGKAYRFDAPVDMFLKVVPGFDISISAGANSIQVHRWSQEPNQSLSGREFLAELSEKGGAVYLPITSDYRWISIFAKNQNQGGGFDGVCFRLNGSVATLLSF